ncbi:sensor domain-containing diguanylate cyclase [Actinomarinicola tropica]|uniref:Diguanylate cyclase n=1 Tax=Actinomarinicola tropica TaxID=2789776 RepID=A0A5Q2RHQ4_9ACTN|nr:sensor domain-containing diguanylate cyclase [Actinomarinicola tropica]QGG94412.1 diguanylate cyclase [Actinomarinicola tropica]
MSPTPRPLPDPTPGDDVADRRAPGRLRRARRTWGLASILTLVAGLTFTGVAFSAERRSAEEEAEKATEVLVGDVTAAFHIELQRQSDLVVSTAGAVATNPDMTTADLEGWVRSARIIERYPELTGVGFVRYVPRAELDVHAARLAADPAVASILGPAGELLVVADTGRAHVCLVQAVGFQATPTEIVEPNIDICADPSLASTIGPMISTGGSVYRSGTTVAGDIPLIVVTPVFAGDEVPSTISARRDAFIGAIATLLDADRVVARVVGDREDVAVDLRYRDAYSDVSFRAGDLAAAAGPQRVAPLVPGWRLTVRAVDDPSVGWTRTAFVLVVAGVAAPVLLATLLYVLGTGRARALTLVDEATEELRHRALHDPLTGLANRGLIAERADALVARARRDGSVPAALFIDLDGFKDVNDTHGHQAGDEVLATLAVRIRDEIRESDTVGRLGGDEFVVLLDGASSVESPESVARRLVEAIRTPILLDGGRVEVTVSASIGVAAGLRADGGQLLHDADVAVYRAKDAGKDGWSLAESVPDVPAAP